MKTFKKIVWVFLTIILLLGVGGYIYFDKKFTPPQNYLTIEKSATEIPIKWVSNEISDISAMLLPVKIDGIPHIFNMQLDLGSPNTIFYLKPLKSIQSNYPNRIKFEEKLNQISLDFSLDEMKISSAEFKLLSYGKKIQWGNEIALNIIGTIGTDLLEKRTVTLDFKNNNCSFNFNLSDTELSNFSDFKFNKRRILLPAIIDKEKLNLLYDSGTSAFELVTSKDNWKVYAEKNGKTTSSKGNSWGNTLIINTKTANKQITIGNKNLKLSEVTYIEGTSTIQNMLMKFSGIEGVIGNKLFIDQKIILDCNSEKFKVE